MRRRLIIDTSYEKAPSDGGFLRCLPSIYSRQEDAFLHRLEVLKEAYFGPTTLAETDHVSMSIPFKRMLERVARGLGAEVRGRAWCGIHPEERLSVLCPFGIGGHEARVLVVGHAPSHRLLDHEPELPFVSVNPQGCAYRFTEELEKVGVQERDLFWVNAMDRSGRYHDADRLLLEPWRGVVALGWDAHGWAVAQGFQNVVSVPHPSYWFREPRRGVYRGAQAVAAMLGA